MQNCDCGAGIGEYHAQNCDSEECFYCGKPLIVCGHAVPLDDRSPWEGQLRAAKTAITLGWWALFTHGNLVECAAGTPNAVPNVDKVYRVCEWDRACLCFRTPPTSEVA